AAHLVGLPDEDVDRELEDVRAFHLDDRRGVLRRVGAELLVATRDLEVAAPVAAETPRKESGAIGGRSHDGRARAVAEDYGGAAVRIVADSRGSPGRDPQDGVR